MTAKPDTIRSLVGVEEAARMLKISESTIRRHIRAGGIMTAKFTGLRLLIPVFEVERLQQLRKRGESK